MKERFDKWITAIKKLPIAFIGCLFLIVICAVSLGVISSNPTMAIPASSLTATFSGEYKIEDGEWQSISEDEHISSTQGEVTLRGKFMVLLRDGEFLTDNPTGFYFNLYCNHISVKVCVGEETVIFETEHPQLGKNACGTMWAQYLFPESADGMTEIIISVRRSPMNCWKIFLLIFQKWKKASMARAS